jgi:hypothetical protein
MTGDFDWEALSSLRMQKTFIEKSKERCQGFKGSRVKLTCLSLEPLTPGILDPYFLIKALTTF